MSETERLVVVKVRTEGEKCAENCRYYNDNKNNSPMTPWIICRLSGEDIVNGVAACRAAEVEVDEEALFWAETIEETLRLLEEIQKGNPPETARGVYIVCQAYLKFATAAGRVSDGNE